MILETNTRFTSIENHFNSEKDTYDTRKNYRHMANAKAILTALQLTLNHANCNL